MGPSAASRLKSAPVAGGTERLPSPFATALRSAPAQNAPSLPHEDRDERFLVALEGEKRLDKRFGRLPVDGILRMRPVQNDACHWSVFLDEHFRHPHLPASFATLIITPAFPGEAWSFHAKDIIVPRDKHIGPRLRSGGEILL